MRKENSYYRSREYLKLDEVITLAEIAEHCSRGQNKIRNKLAILMTFYHGLRANELVSMRWDDLDLVQGSIYVRRSKGSVSATHMLYQGELELLNLMLRTNVYVFVTESGKRMTPVTFSRMVERLRDEAFSRGLPGGIHAHMLRHSCGFWLVNEGHDIRVIQGYLGHKNIQNTVTYTELDANRFSGIEDPFKKDAA
ncbi:tyrosine-type recombinase/integrase [Leptothoe sp. LEGE 181152]|nr:tyrosine-type recombinase/integrase [Leptothoe sp. LEGE 181152]